MMINDIYELYPFVNMPSFAMQPPTLLSLMESLANQNESVKARDLAKTARPYIFDFNYPLSDKVTKEDFEIAILNHYITRRISFESFRLWQIQFDNKLNEIMPKYNILFNALDGWELYKDGSTVRTLDENGTSENTASGTIEQSGTSTSNSSGNVTDSQTTKGSQTSNQSGMTTDDKTEKLRTSDTPQTYLDGVDNAIYVSAYASNTYVDTGSNTQATKSESTQTVTGTSDTNSETTATSTANGATSDKSECTTTHKLTETITRDSARQSEILTSFIADYKNIMTLIYRDLDELFYSVIDY